MGANQYGRFGFPSMVNNALGNKSSSNNNKSGNSAFIVRVTKVYLTPISGDPGTENFTTIGSIEGERISSQGILTGQIITNIRPLDPYKKIIPLINEFVLIQYVIAPNAMSGQFVYTSPISLYGISAINVNPSPSPYVNPKPDSQNVNYFQSFTGATNIVSNENVELDYNSNDQLDSTFKERSNIHPLLPFEGDIIYESRWGSSLRFGSTTKPKNPWSKSGTNGDPITIIRNGQDPKSSDFGAEPIIENIKKDLSSIYLTSTQQIENLNLANENFISYTTPPTTPASYNKPQIALKSSRIILNADSDNILISGEKSVGLSSNNSINIEAKQVYLDGIDIRLGRKTASQAVLKGNDTVDYLKIILTELKNLTEALKALQDWPAGTPVPNSVMLTVADSSQKVFEDVYNNIDNIKSNFVKVI